MGKKNRQVVAEGYVRGEAIIKGAQGSFLNNETVLCLDYVGGNMNL